MSAPFQIALLLAVTASSVAAEPVEQDRDLLRPGSPITSEISPVDTEIDAPKLDDVLGYGPARGRRFRLQVETTGTYHVELDSYFVDTYLVVSDDEGRVLGEDDDAAIHTNSLVVIEELEAGKTYYVGAGALHRGIGAIEIRCVAGRPEPIGRFDELERTIEMLEAELEAREQAFGTEDLRLVATLSYLASAFDDEGDIGTAWDHAERALAIVAGNTQRSFREGSMCMRRLARTLDQLGATDEAFGVFAAALELAEAAHGPNHVETATICFQWATMLVESHDAEEAEPLYARALAIQRAAIGPRHPRTARTIEQLALLHIAAGDDATARAELEQVLAIRDAALSPNDSEIADACDELARLLQRTGDSAAARVLAERALAIARANHGADAAETAEAEQLLGVLLVELGDLAGARAKLEGALAIQVEKLHPASTSTAATRHHLAGVLRSLGELSAARPLAERAFAIRRDALGAAHRDTKASQELLDRIVVELGR